MEFSKCHLNPTCGSGTFLTHAMAMMFNEINDGENFHEEQKIIKESKLIENRFSALPRFRNIYDRVLMNPPFAQKDSELKFVYEMLRNMKEGGIFNLAHLKAVVSLPSNLFYPVGANTCMVIFKKGKNENNETLLINALDDGFVVLSETRVDIYSRWEGIKEEILRAYIYGEFDEFRAIIRTNLKANDELLFEAYSSHRPVDIERGVFARYIRENIAAKVLCAKELKATSLKVKKLKAYSYERFFISDLIEKVANGNEKSIQRTLEDKYDLSGIPLIIAKKDNNGVGGSPRHLKVMRIKFVS